MTVFTIGHSTRELAELVRILKHYQIAVLADVRSVPRSRHTPQFNEDNLAKILPRSGIEYMHLESLGGLRHTTKGSVNMGWHNESFRGYADYMQTAGFAQGLEELLALAARYDSPSCSDAVQGSQEKRAMRTSGTVSERSYAADAAMRRESPQRQASSGDRATARGAVAIMCAEAVPWRCHRSLIGDALLVRGVEVIDIFDEQKTQNEKLTSFAKTDGQTITYPPETVKP